MKPRRTLNPIQKCCMYDRDGTKQTFQEIVDSFATFQVQAEVARLSYIHHS